MTSSGRYPKIASAALFQVAMVPSKFVLIIASFEDSTMAADDGQYLTEEAIAIRSSVRTCGANAGMTQQHRPFKLDPTGAIFIFSPAKVFLRSSVENFYLSQINN